jgi:hypothetical protein
MNFYKWLTVIGGVLTLFGILTAFMSSKYTESLMGEARKGVAVWAPDSSSPEWKEKERLLWWADFWFYVGLVLTTLGVILQTLGGILPLRD